MAQYMKTEEGYKEIIEVAEPFISTKMDANNPVGIGSFSMNRKKGTINGDYSSTEGYCTEANGYGSHAEGVNTLSGSEASHAEGHSTVAIGKASHAEGYRTRASVAYQHVQGKYNMIDLFLYAHIVGNGKDDNNRSNAHTLDWDGNAWFAGDVYTGSTSGKNKDAGSKKLATEEYVTNATTAISVPTKTSDLTNDSKFIAFTEIGDIDDLP